MLAIGSCCCGRCSVAWTCVGCLFDVCLPDARMRDSQVRALVVGLVSGVVARPASSVVSTLRVMVHRRAATTKRSSARVAGRCEHTPIPPALRNTWYDSAFMCKACVGFFVASWLPEIPTPRSLVQVDLAGPCMQPMYLVLLCALSPHGARRPEGSRKATSCTASREQGELLAHARATTPYCDSSESKDEHRRLRTTPGNLDRSCRLR